MDEYIKQSIDSRKNAIFSAYNLDESARKKVENLFSEIEKLGEKSKDVGEFETEFQKSPLNQKYLDLFTEIATTCQPKTTAAQSGIKKPSIGKIVAEGAALGFADRAALEAAHAVLPTRAALNQKVYDKTRKIPVLGDALDISEKASYAAHLGKVFKRKKKEKE